MNKKHRRRKKAHAQAHQGQQAVRKYLAELAARDKAKEQKKGKPGVTREMERQGYAPDGRGGWRRLSRARRKLRGNR